MFNQGKRSCRTPHLLAGVVVCLFSGIWHIPSMYAANATPVSCSSDAHFANSCTQCFVSDPLYLGNADVNFRDQWQASLTGSGEEIYLNENTGAVSIDYGYTDGALTSNLVPGIGPWFHFADGAGESGSDGMLSNGEAYVDSRYGKYFKFPANSFGDIIRSDAGGFIKFNTKTASIIANKRSKPLYQLKYTLNYWDVNTYDRMRTHQECIISYPAFCGDGVRDTSRGESCDDGDANGQSGKCNTTCTGTMPTDGACGVANNRPTYELTAVSGELCTSGSSANVALSGSLYSWSCLGANSGTTTYCSAPKKSDGVCGTDNGKTLGSIPTNLCTSGASSAVSGSGPWTWSCMGTNGGVTTSCSANKTIVPPPATCSQFFTGALRVGRSYSFPDYYSNGNSYAHTLTSFDVNFLESSDMNRDGLINRYNSFIWSPTLNPSRIINAGQSDVQIIKADPNYLVQDAPTAGRRSDNIQIQYTINGTSVGGDISHKECIDYAVTWCGDGVLDTTYGEQCDPNDTSRSGWGSGGCNATSCLPINTPSGFDLSLKKYVDTVAPANDADTETTAINKTSNTNFSYQVVVRNEGAGAVSGVTTVNDTLPANILFASASGAVSGAGWSCNQSTNNFTCTRSDSTASGTAFAPISVSVRTSATVSAGTVIRNDATVSNPNETDVISNTNPAYIRVTGDIVGSGVLSIKKYASTIATGDSQNESSAVGVSRGAEFNYLYRVTVSSGSVSGAIVRDVLPEHVEFVRFASTPAGWSTGSTTTTHSGHTHAVIMHQTDNILPSGSTYDFTIVARLRSESIGQYHQNIVYVCPKKILSGDSLIDNPACTTSVPPLPPDTGCPARAADTQSDPACIKANDGFDLSIRKYINSDDAETAINLAGGATFNYRMVVTNNGPAVVNGTTFVSDTFPAGVERTVGAITGTGWNCSASSGSTLSCYSIQTVAVGGTFPEIVVPMRVTAGDNTTVTNTVCVTNANESATKTLAGGDTTNCNSAVLRAPPTSCPTYPGESCGVTPLSCTSFSIGALTSNSHGGKNANLVCAGNYLSRSYGIDVNGDKIIDIRGSFATGNPAVVPVEYNQPGTFTGKCIVSAAPDFPMALGQNYENEWSKYSSYIDSNDNSCRQAITIGTPICGDGNKDVGEKCDPSVYTVGGANPLWGSCGHPGTYNQCSNGTGTPICGDGKLSSDEQCDPSVYTQDPSKWQNCGKPGSVAGTTKLVTSYYDVCSGLRTLDRVVTRVGECQIGQNPDDISTQPLSCLLPKITINPSENTSSEFALFDGENIYGKYNLIIGQNTPVFRIGDQLNIRAPNKILLEDTDQVVIGSNGDFITQGYLKTPVTGTYGTSYRCIGGEELVSETVGYLNDFNSYWDLTSGKRIACKPWKFKTFTSPSDIANIAKFRGQDLGGLLVDKSRWNVDGNKDYAQTNNKENRTYNHGDPDFYVTLHHAGDADNMIRLDAPINVRVTRPIIANNAGGAGYFSVTTSDSYISLNEVTSGFLEQLKAANFNTGKVVGGSASSTFLLNNIVPVGRTDLASITELTNSSTRMMHTGDVTITTTPNISTKKTVVVNGKLTINADIKANASVAFIAKEIVIGSGVTRLDGIYIANSIKGVSGGSQLIVNGSLYGDASELIKARTYARGSSASSGIVTGILVNYSSRVLSDPPPLVSDFLKQYNLTKVTSVQ